MYKVKELSFIDSETFFKVSNTFNMDTYPCYFGKTSFKNNLMYANIYKDLEIDSIRELANDLREMSIHLDNQQTEKEKMFNTFISIFDIDDSKISFEQIWYKVIRQLIKFDNQPWKSNATKDLNDPNFKLSFDNKLWYPVLITPNHINLIRRSNITILSFQPDQTFILNEKLDNKSYQKMRNKVHEKINSIYNSDKPHYISNHSTGKGIVQFLGYDFEIEKGFKYPDIFTDFSIF